MGFKEIIFQKLKLLIVLQEYTVKNGAKLPDSEINGNNQNFNHFSKINKVKDETSVFSKNPTNNIEDCPIINF